MDISNSFLVYKIGFFEFYMYDFFKQKYISGTYAFIRKGYKISIDESMDHLQKIKRHYGIIALKMLENARSFVIKTPDHGKKLLLYCGNYTAFRVKFHAACYIIIFKNRSNIFVNLSRCIIYYLF